MTAHIDVHAFYVEKATAASYRVGETITNIGQLRACLQHQARLKFDKEWLQVPDLHPDPDSVLLATNVHGTSMLEDNLMTIQSVCDSADHILAIIPSKQLSPSVAPSLTATATQSLASPAHMKSQELINLVVSMNDALRIKDNMRVEQQVDFHATLQSFQRDQLRREEDVKLNFQRYTKEVEQQLKDTQHQCNILKQEHTLDQLCIKFLEDRQQEDRQHIKDLEDKQQQDSSRIQDLESSLLEEKKFRVEEKEASDKEKEASEKEKDTKLMDHILLRHLLDLTQAKLAVASGLPRNNKTFRITQSFLWREALSSSQTTPEHVQAAKKLLNAPGLSLDAATKKFALSDSGMNIVVQRPSVIRDMGDSAAHPKHVSREAFKKI
ncbi:uncharacterized protein EDB93DRAFT_1195755, partial [Suillus bovinus]|uniref:uncharacterized protein n=1 Tax=Suillus bovinus TaxID=48563 RepID=UPI001B8794F8